MSVSSSISKFTRAAVVAAFAVVSVASVYAQDTRPRYSARNSGERSWTIPEETVISMRMDGNLNSRTSHVGDKFSATVTIPVYINGRTVIPAGSVVEGRVTQVTPAKRMSKSGTIAVAFDELIFPNGARVGLVGNLTSDDPEMQETIDDESRVSGDIDNRKVVFVGGGGAVGAVLGGIAGGGKGAVLGGVLGAGAGVAGVLLSKGEEARVPSGTPFGIKLQQPLVVKESFVTEGGAVATRQADRYPPSDQGDRDDQPREYSRPDPADSTGPDAPPETDRSPRDNSRSDTVDPTPEPPPATASLPLSSPEMIRRAQAALKDQGYYEGQVDGNMGPRTSNALRTFQRENNLAETGDLDPETARKLGILGGASTATASQRTPERPAAVPVATRTTTTTSPNPSTVTPPNPSAAMSLQRQAEEMLAEYQRNLGVRLTGTGVELDQRGQYREPEMELLFALDSFANAAQLYSRLLTSLRDPDGLRGATLALAREARRADRLITTTSARSAEALNLRWDAIRQDVLRLMHAQRIDSSEIDN